MTKDMITLVVVKEGVVMKGSKVDDSKSVYKIYNRDNIDSIESVIPEGSVKMYKEITLPECNFLSFVRRSFPNTQDLGEKLWNSEVEVVLENVYQKLVKDLLK